MESSESRTFAQFGGFLLLVSLALPYFALSFAGLGSHGFRVWTMDKGAFVLVAAYGGLALAQVKLSSRETMALIYLIVGGLFTAALIYKFWISPPGSAPIGDLAGAGGGSGTMKVNGQDVSGLSTNDILKAIGIELKPSYGAYVAMLGSVFFTAGAFLEFRNAGSAPATPVTTPAMAGAAAAVPQAAAAGQRYQAPVPAQQRYVAPDPFAAAPPPGTQPVAAQPPVPVVPPDPFANPQLRQTAPAAQAPQPPTPPPGPAAPQ